MKMRRIPFEILAQQKQYAVLEAKGIWNGSHEKTAKPQEACNLCQQQARLREMFQYLSAYHAIEGACCKRKWCAQVQLNHSLQLAILQSEQERLPVNVGSSDCVAFREQTLQCAIPAAEIQHAFSPSDPRLKKHGPLLSSICESITAACRMVRAVDLFQQIRHGSLGDQTAVPSVT